jgi:hypothetical protein
MLAQIEQQSSEAGYWSRSQGVVGACVKLNGTCDRDSGAKEASPRSSRWTWPNETTSCPTSASSATHAHDLLLKRTQFMEPNCPDSLVATCLARLRRFFEPHSRDTPRAVTTLVRPDGGECCAVLLCTAHAPYVEYVPPDTTAAIFWLKNRCPAQWRDRWQLEHISQ